MSSTSSLKNLKSIRDLSFSPALTRRLLGYQTQAPFQTPLLAENGTAFLEKWFQQGSELPLSSFAPVTAAFSAEAQAALIENFESALEDSLQKHHTENLYLVLGFVLWFDAKSPGTARLSPSLLVPLEWISEAKSLKISNRLPVIENILLRLKFEGKAEFPKASDAMNGTAFDVRKYFSLLESVVAGQANWKISQKGISLCFLNSSQLHSFKDLDGLLRQENLADHALFSELLDDNGFQHQASPFEEKAVDDYFYPAERHFIYTPDASSTLAMMDSLYGNRSLYCIQAPVGSTKYETLANILGEAAAQDKKVLVVSGKTVSQRRLQAAFRPASFAYSAPQNRIQVLNEFSGLHDSVKNYYRTLNSNSSIGNVSLGESMRILSEVPQTKKQKTADGIFSGSEKLSRKEYDVSQEHLGALIELLNRDGSRAAQDFFQGIEIPVWNPEKKAELGKLLDESLECASALEAVADVLKENPYFKEISLGDLIRIDETARGYFTKNTPSFHRWDLLSKDWDVYTDDFLALPAAGTAWTAYRRTGSALFSDDAIEENIYADRIEIQESSDKTFKVFSEKYREAKKRLFGLFKTPPKFKDDEEMLKQIDALILLQEQRKLFRIMSILAHRLCGEDWAYEKTKWNSFHSKLRWLFPFRKRVKDDPSGDLILSILSCYSALEAALPEGKTLKDLCLSLAENLAKIEAILRFDHRFNEQPFDSLFYNLQQWKKGIDLIELYVEIQRESGVLQKMGLGPLLKEALQPQSLRGELATVYKRFWYSLQIQDICKNYPNLFSLSAISCNKTEKEYRRLYDLLNLCNYQLIQEKLTKNPQQIQWKFYNEVRFEFPLRENIFDLILFTDADSISVPEALPICYRAPQIILAGDSQNPLPLPVNFENENPPPGQAYASFEQDHIFAYALRQGCESADLTFCKEYRHPALFDFANEEFYQKKLKTLPQTSEKVFGGLKIQEFPQPQSLLLNAIITHAGTSKHQSLGVIVFSEERRQALLGMLETKIEENPEIRDFFAPKDIFRDFYIKLPEEAVEDLRDILFVFAEASPSVANPKNGPRLVNVCATHALQQLVVFTEETVSITQNSTNSGIQAYRRWLHSVQNQTSPYAVSDRIAQTPLIAEVMQTLADESLHAEVHWGYRHACVSAVVRDANNPHRFLAAIEDDSMGSYLRNSVAELACIRPQFLQRLGWKVIRLWTPVWFLSTAEERDHLVTSIAIEQSVAPPPEQALETDESGTKKAFDLKVEHYEVLRFKIEGTEYEKPLPELTSKQLVFEMKHYIEHEAPIHENVLRKRLLDLHRVGNPGPKIKQALNEAIALGLQKKIFIQTGHFFYTPAPKPVILRYRAGLPEEERMFAYLSPEERTLLPASMSDSEIKEALGLI